MANPNLVPRLNYGYNFVDALISFFSLFRKLPVSFFLENLFRSKNIFFVNHARTGLRLVLNSIGIKKGSNVGVQVFNCYTVFNSIKAAGMQPVFLDVNDDFTIDVKDLKKKSGDLDCLIITHTFGVPADIQKIREIFYNKPIIEDCAHSFLSCYKGKLTGTYGDAAIFSFSQGKFPSIGSGGFVIVKNKYVASFRKQFNKLNEKSYAAEAINILKNLALSIIHKRPIYGILTNPFLKNKIQPDFSKLVQKESKCYKSNESLFYYKSRYFKKYIELQQKNALRILKYIKKPYFSNINYFMIPFITKKHQHIIRYCFNKGVEVGRHFNKSIEWAKAHGYIIGSCPNAEKLLNNFVTLSCYYSYPPKEILKYQNLIKCEY